MSAKLSGFANAARIEAELAEWPGVELVAFKKGRKHSRLTVRFKDSERFMMLASTPSDRHAEHNQVRALRKVMAELGAVRNERRKASGKRKRNRPARTALGNIAPAPVIADPWAALQAVTFAPPAVQPKRPSLWARILSALRIRLRSIAA